MRYSDKPILKPSQDLLGRAGYALELAKAIDRLTVAKDGFVIGILGDWGSGKTSVIQLITRFLRHIEMERASEKPILDDEHARPCSIPEIETMAEIFERVESRVAEMEAAKLNLAYWQREERIADFRKWLTSDIDADRAQRYWQLKFAVEAAPRTVIVRFSPWLVAARAELASALLSELARSLGEKLGSDVRDAFADLLQRLAELAPIASAAADMATVGSGLGKFIASAGMWSGQLGKRMSTGPTLDDLRQQLRSILLRLDDRRVLVIIDDLDRLTPPEALEMVSLVKSLGDLPNVIYLLAYEEQKLSELIKVALDIEGNSFLEKIIQYPVHLPTIADRDLSRLLDADLSALVGTLSQAELQRLAGTWHFMFRHYLKTPRDVRRYVNSLSVSIPALGAHLDIVDVVLLELLRLFEPTIYWWVRGHIEELAN